MITPAITIANQNVPEFLVGGGEMGQRIRDYNWSNSPLGPVEMWPQSLRTCVRIMLTSRQPIWIGWGKQLIKLYNDPYKEIVRGKHPSALGEPASIVWKDIWRDIEPMLTQVMEKDEGTYVESQLLIMERNGYPEETYYTFSYTPIPGDDGTTAGMICANSDDTDRIISERQLKTLMQLGKSLTDAKSNHDIIAETLAALADNTHDFPFTSFYSLTDNKALLSSDTPFGETLTILPPLVDLNGDGEFSGLLREAASSRRLQIWEDLKMKIGVLPKGAWEIAPDKALILPIVQAASKGPFGFLIVGFNPFRLLDDKYISFFSLVADQIATSFSDVHLLEEERKRADALAEIDRAKTTFFSNISHEFRTPLTLLLGPIEDALSDPGMIGENRVRMQVAYRNALRMQKLVNTLLDFSRIEAGRMEGKFSRVDIGTFTRDLASNFRSAIEKAGMQLNIYLDKVSDEVYVDIDMWEKIILNLVSNAFKYSKEGAITINVKQQESEIQVIVSDTGIGIPEDQLGKIFNRFHRVENTEGRSQEGTGIGLAMVKELVKFHDGSIDVTSKLGEGSRFTVTIPAGKAHLPKNKIIDVPVADMTASHSAAFVQEALKWSNNSTLQPGNHEMEIVPLVPGNENNRDAGLRSKILLADDNADMRDYVRRLLSDHFIVITAVDGMDAFDKILLHKPDLLLADIMMPKLDGMGLLKKIRSHTDLRGTPVIFLSARAGEEAKVEGLDAGADDYLIKPFSAKELLVRITNHIRINQVRKETEQQFYQLFLQAPAFINVLKGPDHRYEFFHPKNKEILKGLDFTGMTVREASPELEGQGILEILDEVYHNGKTITQNDRQVSFVDKRGELVQRYLNYIFQPWYDLKGRIQGVLNFAIDVTEMVETRKEIEESEKRFRTLAETLPQLIWMTDSKGKQLYASSRWKEYSGLEANADSWPLVVHPADIDVVSDTWEASIRSGKVYKIEVRLKNKQGEYRWFYGQGEPIFGETGEIIKWIGSFTDIQDQKEIEKRLEKLVAERTLELHRSNEDLQQFAHVASHDLKEPVRKIKTFSDRLYVECNDILPEQGKKFISKIQTATDRMYAMIEGVLNYSTLNARVQPIEWLDLNQIIDNIEVDLELTMQQKNAAVQKTMLPGIEGASVLIYQLFYNLINNSLKFSTGERAPAISISSIPYQDAGREMAKIIIADNGIGFGQEYAEKIFDTFLRLNSKDKYEGTGLGLALCKKIVERHHGKIYATGKINEGAAFTIVIPINQTSKQI